MSNTTKEVVNPFAALQGNLTSDSKEVAPSTKKRASTVEIMGQNYEQQYTDLRVYHRLNEDGKLELKDSTSGKNSMFAIASKSIHYKGAQFFVMAQIGLKK